MNVTIPENKVDKKSKIVYSLIIGICIISIILVVYIQFFDGRIVQSVGNLKGKSDQNYEELKSEFKFLFNNNFLSNDEKYQNIKEDNDKKLVYTSYISKENKSETFSLNVNIPYININNNTVKEYNNEIKSTFQNKAEEIVSTSKNLTLYTVDYTANIEDGVLSVVIYATLKEGTNPQRVIIKTYNYSLEENREVDLVDVLNLENVTKVHVQNRIDKEIEMAHKKAEDLKEMGTPIYERNLQNDTYNIDNVSEFYFYNGTIYIIYAYGNNNYTSEVDLVII